jgi:hypothetical protein
MMLGVCDTKAVCDVTVTEKPRLDLDLIYFKYRSVHHAVRIHNMGDN